MGLLTKEVEVRIDSSNKQYYKNLGYEIPEYYDKWNNCYRTKRGTTIIVDIKDLHPGSYIRVDVECDECHNKKDIMYFSYCQRRHQNEIGDKYYCKSCASKKYITGINNHFWNPNLTDEERENTHKRTTKYNKFIRGVYARDKYTCQCCGKTNSETIIEAHHLDGFDWCKEKRTDITNGITLCHNCHSNFHVKYGRGNNTKEQFEEWIGYSVELLKFEKELNPAKKIYCIEDDIVYLSAYVVKQKYKLSSATQVYDACNRNSTKIRTIKNKHFLYYDEYLAMSKKEVDYYVNVFKASRLRPVRCITTNEIFQRIVDAEKKYPQSKKIWDCCKGKQKYSGKLEDGTKLQWEYYIQSA